MGERLTFQKVSYDRGNCRTYYQLFGDKLRPKRVFCRIDGSDTMMICSLDGEPSHSIGNTKYRTVGDTNA